MVAVRRRCHDPSMVSGRAKPLVRCKMYSMALREGGEADVFRCRSLQEQQNVGTG